MEHGIRARTASRRGSDVFFDWDDPVTYPGALAGTDRVYLVTPALRVRYAGQVAAFLDQAEAAGVRHVTFLSTCNGDRAPREIDIAAVAVETLLNPDAHAGARYALTGPQAITFGDVAATIAAVSGQPVVYKDRPGGLDQRGHRGRPAHRLRRNAPQAHRRHHRLRGVRAHGRHRVRCRPAAASFEAFARRNAAAWSTPEDK